MLPGRELFPDEVDGLGVRQVVVVHLVLQVGRHLRQVTHVSVSSGRGGDEQNDLAPIFEKMWRVL